MKKDPLAVKLLTALLSKETPEAREKALREAEARADEAREQLRIAQAARISGYVGAGLTVASLLFVTAFLHARSRRAADA